MDASIAAKNALKNVLEVSINEKIVIICDEEKTKIGEAFAKGALDLDLWTRLVILKKPKEPRGSIPQNLEDILNQKPEIYINLLKGSREETPFRISLIKKETVDHKSRLGHCPGVTYDMLTEGALALTTEEHKAMQSHAETIMTILENSMVVNVTNPAGTNLSFSTNGRKFFTDTKLDWNTMKWMNLPTGEVIVAPVEDSLNGKFVCDMAVGGIGKLIKPIEITVKNGKVIEAHSEDKENLSRIKETFQMDKWASVVGEFALGINPKARFVDEFLEAEKIFATVHLAFGENTDMPGGKNPSKNHMDMLISEPTVTVKKQKGEIVTILEKGIFRV